MGRTEGFQYAVSSHGNYWYIKTNEEGAHNFKGKSSWKFETVTKLFSNNSFRVVIKVPVGEPMNKDLWETILEHREDVLIKEIELFRHHFVVWEWENGTQKVRIQDLSDGGTEALRIIRCRANIFIRSEVHYINFTEPLYCIWPGEVEDQEDTLATRYFNTNRLRFSYTSFLQPTIVYDYDMDNCQKRKVKESYVTGFVREDYYQKRIWATTKDGGQIPITLVYKISLRNHQGGNPTVSSTNLPNKVIANIAIKLDFMRLWCLR
jgi:oligopeptidase B